MGKLYNITQERAKRSRGPAYDGAFREAVRHKREIAITLRNVGLSYGQIAEKLGYATPQGAYALIHNTRLRGNGNGAA